MIQFLQIKFLRMYPGRKSKRKSIIRKKFPPGHHLRWWPPQVKIFFQFGEKSAYTFFPMISFSSHCFSRVPIFWGAAGNWIHIEREAGSYFWRLSSVTRRELDSFTGTPSANRKGNH